MQFTSFFSAAVALATAATAAPMEARKASGLAVVNLVAVTSTDIRYQTMRDISVEFGKLTYIENVEVTEIRVKDVTITGKDIPKPKVDNVVCQRYLNEHGTKAGSELFTKKTPALIATNAIPLNWLLCYVVKN
ncbi:hypothetical protein B0T10DRAFT_610698 [Thelonectria olida]|uniref:Uncharacterized protein n=1 Tax=Thelonectria olida TaxID=1576542 RepID=A0A9P8VT43_9HYPO|nr:hypothetical protein B0T10DRAFT_610698 [Thelonectria olida]